MLPRPSRYALLTLLLVAQSGCDGHAANGEPDAVPLLPIHAVQGTAERSPLEGQWVRIEGVVTGRFSDGQGGVFVQGLTDDANPATAEGLYLLPAADQPDLETGQWIRAEGQVAEAGHGASLTTLTDAKVTLLGAQPLPPRLRLDAPPQAGWESLEGMRVEVVVPLTVTGNHALSQYGELILSFGGRLSAPTEVAAPGAEALAVSTAQAARSLRLDDGRALANPRTIRWLGDALTDDAPLRVGSTLEGVRGIIDQRHGSYRLHMRSPVKRIVQAPRPAAPQVAGSVRVVSMNLLNLFNGDGSGGGFPTPRGAADVEAYQRQLAKHLSTLRALDPHLVAVQEVENDGEDPASAQAQLVAALNAAAGSVQWDFVRTAQAPGSDQIRVGLLYRRDMLRPVGASALRLDGPFRRGARVPLAQSFQAGRGPVFTVVVNHFKSKGGCPEASGADVDQRDGQGCFNAQRVSAAQALHDWLATDPTGSGSDLRMIVGDLNAYAKEDPVRWLLERGWQDPFAGVEGVYSYVFDGQAGRLDHALLSPAMQARLRGAAIWHSNADEAPEFAYAGDDDGDPWRASDHDPTLLGFDLH